MSKSQKNVFIEENPKKQVLAKTDLAKYVMSWQQKPHIVSQGAQKNFKAFAELTANLWEKSNEQFSDMYFKQTVAKAIMFKYLEAAVSGAEWYSGGYRANIVTYSMASLAYLIQKQNRFFNFGYVWKYQELSENTQFILKILIKKIYEHLIDTPENISNVTEWAKKELCWKNLMAKLDLGLIDHVGGFTEELIEKEEIQLEKKEAKKVQRIDNEANVLNELVKIAPESWHKMIEWGINKKLLEDAEINLMMKAANMTITMKLPNKIESNKLVNIIKKLQLEGMTIIDKEL
jgi:hypothetical protein